MRLSSACLRGQVVLLNVMGENTHHGGKTVAKASKFRLFRWIALFVIMAGILTFIILDNQKDPGMTVVADIDGSQIHLFEIEREIKNYYEQIGGNQQITDDNLDDLRVSVMDVLVEQKIVLNDAAKKGYQADPAEIDASLKDQIEQAGSQAVWEAFLSSWGFTEESFRKYMEDIYTIDNYPLTQWTIPEVTEDQVLAEYNERVKTSPSLVYEEAKDFIRTTLEVDNEVGISKAWFEGLKAASDIKIYDKRVLGRKAFAEEKYEDAISLYKKAMKSEPDDPYIDVSIAKAYAKLGDTKNMEKYFESAVKKDDKNTFVHMAKAKLLIEMEDPDSAIEEVRKAVEVADVTNLPLLERLEELTLELGMETESDQLDKLIRAIMMPDSLVTK